MCLSPLMENSLSEAAEPRRHPIAWYHEYNGGRAFTPKWDIR